MRFKLEAKPGPKEVGERLRRAGILSLRKVRDALLQTATAIRNRYVRAVQKGPKSGRVYDWIIDTMLPRDKAYRLIRVPSGYLLPADKRAVPHVASAPGESPATDSGRLVGSISFNIDGLTAEAGAAALYAPFLEDGTKWMDPRPALMPAVEAEEDDFFRRIDEAILGMGAK